MKFLKILLKLIAGLFLLGLVIVVLPLATIWSLNTLFALSIAYTWQTWLAAQILLTPFSIGTVTGTIRSGNRSDKGTK